MHSAAGNVGSCANGQDETKESSGYFSCLHDLIMAGESDGLRAEIELNDETLNLWLEQLDASSDMTSETLTSTSRTEVSKESGDKMQTDDNPHSSKEVRDYVAYNIAAYGTAMHSAAENAGSCANGEDGTEESNGDLSCLKDSIIVAESVGLRAEMELDDETLNSWLEQLGATSDMTSGTLVSASMTEVNHENDDKVQTDDNPHSSKELRDHVGYNIAAYGKRYSACNAAEANSLGDSSSWSNFNREKEGNIGVHVDGKRFTRDDVEPDRKLSLIEERNDTSKFVSKVYKHFGPKHDDNAQLSECSECDYATNRKWNLTAVHIRNHSCKAKFYKCVHCSYTTEQKHDLNQHVKVKHDDEAKSYRCVHCGYITKQEGNLNQHVREKHDEAKLYKCVHCGYTTKRKKCLYWHVKVKHDESAELYKCVHCDYASKLKGNLNYHIKVMHDKNAELYKCVHCNHMTKRKGDLKQHLKILHDDKAELYKCQYCVYTTKGMQNLKKHAKRKHNDKAMVT